MEHKVGFLTEAEIDALLREAEEQLAVAVSEKAAQVAVPVKAQTESAATTLVVKPASATPLPAASTAAKAKQAANIVGLRVPVPDKKKDKNTPDNAGPDWFGLPKTIVTPEAKRDFQILRMRGVLDPKHHFRKDTRKDLIPKFSVFGTIVEGGMEGERGRLARKERKRTIVEEVLASQEANESFKRRYNKIHEERKGGKKGFYKRLVAQRKRRR